MNRSEKKLFSIVIPVYFNEQNIPETVPHLLALKSGLPSFALELIFVDDGSGDGSLPMLLKFQQHHPNEIKVVKLTRNFGSMSAIQAGFTVATGDCVGMISADLQDPPEIFLDMLSHWEKGTKAVFAIRQDRQERPVQKMFSNTYYALIRWLAITDYPTGGFDFFLIDRQVVDELNGIQEKNTNLMTLVYWLGYKPVLIPYIRRQRTKGLSRWTFAKKIKLFVDTFVAFSFFPIRILSLIGLLVATGSFLYGAFVLFYWFYYGIEVRGWVPTIVVLSFTSGIQMAMLGVLGEYLWRTLDEVRRRPPYVIDEVYEVSPERDAVETDKIKEAK
ncbi:MAG: glycosyltransferase family 2 protein [Anaerolineae bacterium]|nr:glycosyltransferase family 2 protein [Anaerolineae bacterium]